MCQCTAKKIIIYDVENLPSAEILCPVHGSSFLYRHNGKWETREQRQERLKRSHLCLTCGAAFFDYKDEHKGQRYLCDRCAERSNSSQDDMELIDPEYRFKRDNVKSPWRGKGKLAFLKKENAYEKYLP